MWSQHKSGPQARYDSPVYATTKYILRAHSKVTKKHNSSYFHGFIHKLKYYASFLPCPFR